MSSTQMLPRSSALERVNAALDNPFRVSPEQRDAARAPAGFLLRACPGAGKTYTVGLRMARHAAEDPERSVAAVSHTNVAVRAIESAARELAPPPDHAFVGTLHSFLLRYVVYPFGHLYMRCPEPPRVAVGDEDWPTVSTALPEHPHLRIVPWRFQVQPDGSFAYDRPLNWPLTVSEERIVADLSGWAREQKRELWRDGLVSFSDVLWIAKRVLERHPQLAEAVGARFDELILDEVQDTSALQLECVARLRRGEEPPDLVIAGDLDQAVYEFGGTSPREVEDFASDQSLRELRLTRNYRSSDRICRVAVHWSTRAEPDDAGGPWRTYDVIPELWCYQLHEEPTLRDRFRGRLSELELPEERSAILTRTNAQADRINGWREPPVSVRWALDVLGEQAVRRDRGEGPTLEGLQALDRVLLRIVVGRSRPPGLTPELRQQVRDASAAVWSDLPPVEGDLRAWNRAAREALDPIVHVLIEELAISVNTAMPDLASYAGHDAVQLLGPRPPALARTIHAAKGESLAGVLVLAREQDLEAWLAELWTEESPESTSEETRVFYVALTRAERLLALAVPESTSDEHVERLRLAGFVGPR